MSHLHFILHSILHFPSIWSPFYLHSSSIFSPFYYALNASKMSSVRILTNTNFSSSFFFPFFSSLPRFPLPRVCPPTKRPGNSGRFWAPCRRPVVTSSLPAVNRSLGDRHRPWTRAKSGGRGMRFGHPSRRFSGAVRPPIAEVGVSFGYSR